MTYLLYVAQMEFASVSSGEETAHPPPQQLRMLTVHDVDLPAAVRLTEHLSVTAEKVDLVILCGPFTSEANHIPLSAEEEAVRIADVSSIIAQFENIVCRVVYLASEYEPAKLKSSKQLSLTPNSMNINRGVLPLMSSLFIAGFLEEEGMLASSGLPFDFDRSADSDDELGDVEVQAPSSASAIHALMDSLHSETAVFENEDSKSSSSSSSNTIFLLHYKYSITLNQFLFHMPEKIGGIALSIIPQQQQENSSPSIDLPTSFGKNMTIVAPKSLRKDGHYYIIFIELQQSSAETEREPSWHVSQVDEFVLDSSPKPLVSAQYI